MIIESFDQLMVICRQTVETRKSQHHDIYLDVLLEKDEEGDYTIPPVHCQRNHIEHSQDLQIQFEDRNGFVDGLGNNFHVAVPTKDFDVYSGNLITYFYTHLKPTLQNGNSRRQLWDSNCPDNYLPTDGIVQVVIKPYDNYQTIKEDYDLIDNKNNAQQGKDEIYGAFRAHNIHKSVNGYIATGKIGRVLKFCYPHIKPNAFRQVESYKDELVCLSNLSNYDTAWSFMGKNNSNRPCALAAVLLLLKERNREDNIKDFVGRIVNEGQKYHSNPIQYFAEVFERFDVAYNTMDTTFQKTNLDKFVMTPIERILWETFEIPRVSKQPGGDQIVPRLSYFGGGAQYQFTNPKRIISFYLYMIQKGMENNISYLTEKTKLVPGTKNTGNERKERIEVFGGSYEKKIKGVMRQELIKSPYDAIIDSIFNDEEDEENGTLEQFL